METKRHIEASFPSLKTAGKEDKKTLLLGFGVGNQTRGGVTMSSNAVFFGWNRSIPGRERISAEHFQGFVRYLGGLQQKGAIQSFDAVLLDSHGGVRANTGQAVMERMRLWSKTIPS
jgi:hypothetical protein